MVELERVKQLIKDRPRKKEITRGIVHEERLRFHTETVLEKSELSNYYNDYIAWISSDKPELLPFDKVARFKQLLTVPLSTIELTESIETSLGRVFDAQDSFLRYDFKDDERLAQWEEARDDTFWRTEGMAAMMNAIDSVWVVDFGKVDGVDEPENLLINISDVVDILTDSKGVCHHVMFIKNNKLFVYDEIAVTVYLIKEGSDLIELKSDEPELLWKHELGYCPAKMFWSEFLTRGNYINHKAPLTNVLADLDWLLTHNTFKKYMDIGNSFPILVAYSSGDDSTDMTPTENEGRTASEEKPLGANYLGPGSINLMPLPTEGQVDLMSNPIKWITPDIDSLEFHVKEDDRLSEGIFKSVVGIGGEENNDMAKNEKQVMASFENETTVLKRVARNFEIIRSFADKVRIELMFGETLDPSIDMGTKFFLKTSSDLITEMEETKTNEMIYDAQFTELLDTKFRNDTVGRTRANVIRDLDPLPGRTIEEATKILEAGGINTETFIIKANLLAFVNRFEREQIPLAKFIEEGEYNIKVNKIQEEFINYAKKTRLDSGQPEPGTQD